MTKNEKKEIMNVWNRINEVEKELNEDFEELQQMSRDLGLDVWCSVEGNKDQLVNHNEEYTRNGCCTTYSRRAKHLYDRYMMNWGARDMLMELGCALARVKAFE